MVIHDLEVVEVRNRTFPQSIKQLKSSMYHTVQNVGSKTRHPNFYQIHSEKLTVTNTSENRTIFVG